MRSESEPISLITDITEEEKKAGRSEFSLKSSALSSLSSGPSSLYVISIAGSQTSGKSTLLNHLFSLNFLTLLPQDNLGQKTRGIDLQLTDCYVCLDMEGSDSGQRAKENNPYIGRMIGAFGLLVSNLLIYNINIQNIGTQREVECLANMMAHYLSICNERRRILFCIRDAIEGYHKEDKIEESITQTFNEAWDRAKVNSNNQTSTAFEMHMITCSKYLEVEGSFVNEKKVMKRLRKKVEEKLQDLNQFEASSLKTLWSEMWNKIYRNEKIEFSKVVVKVAWDVLREKLSDKCMSLASEMLSSGDYYDKLNEYETQISNEILANYANDEYAKEALLTLVKQELVKKAVYLEVEHFKISIDNYFRKKSEDPPNLYADLISIYQKIDIKVSDRDRIIHSEYMKLLHKSAKDQNLYIDTIKNSLNSILSISQERTNRNLAQLNEADINKLKIEFDFSDQAEVDFTFFNEVWPAVVNIVRSLIALVKIVVRVGKMGAGLWCIFQEGATIVASVNTLKEIANWSKEDLWREMAHDGLKSFICNDSFENILKKLMDIQIIRDPLEV